MTEIWAPIDDGYEVSNLGNVRSVDRKVTYSDGRVGNFHGRPMRPARGKNGYLTATVGRSRRAMVHRLVAAAFVENPLGMTMVNHINGDKRDNRAINLEWCDFTTNNRHARETGLNTQHAENCNLTIYGTHFVEAVRRVYDAYKPTYSELALLFDISQAQARDIAKGRTRKRG